jgi:hypothetical protein
MMIDRGYRPKIQQTRTNRKTKPLAYSMGHSKNTYYKYRIYHREVRLNGPLPFLPFFVCMLEVISQSELGSLR